MNELKLEPVRICEEDSVVLRSVVRVLSGRVKHIGINVAKKLVEAINVGPALRSKGQVVQTRDVTVMTARVFGRLEGN